MTDAEKESRIKMCRLRRQNLNATQGSVAEELCVARSTIGRWERLIYGLPHPTFIAAYENLLDKAEAGQVKLQGPKLPTRDPREKGNAPEAKHISLREVSILMGQLRRVLGCSEREAAGVLGLGLREFQMIEGGLAATTKVGLSRLLAHYAEQLLPRELSECRQLTFDLGLTQDEPGMQTKEVPLCGVDAQS